jgi:hypothetical protein
MEIGSSFDWIGVSLGIRPEPEDRNPKNLSPNN